MKTTVEISYKGVPLEVVGFYEKEEPMVWMYTDGSGYDGSPASFEVYSVFVGGVDIYSILEDDLDEIEGLCVESLVG